MSPIVFLFTVSTLLCSYITHGENGKNNSYDSSKVRRIDLIDEEKYRNPYEDSDEYFYDNTNLTTRDRDNANSIEDTEKDDSVVTDSIAEAIVLDHVEFVLLRLKHIANKMSDNVTEILVVQKEEFQENELYETGWNVAVKLYNEGIKESIFNATSPDSIVHKVPVEYHIALVAYTLNDPSLHWGFNKDTREVCSGNDIGSYKWKSYFKLLQLAVQTLGTQVDKWVDHNRFLYRGSSLAFHLEPGQILAFQQFSSSSVSLAVAEFFAEMGNTTNYRTIFEYQGFYNGTAVALWDHSYYPEEREILFSPLQVFKVDSAHVGMHYTRYVLVKHEESFSSHDYDNEIYAHPGIKNDLDCVRISGQSDFFDASTGDRTTKSVFSLTILIMMQIVLF